MTCPTHKIAIALAIFVLVASPTHLYVWAAEQPSEVGGVISRGEKNLQHSAIPSELITRELRKRNPAFAISVESVLRKLKKRDEVIPKENSIGFDLMEMGSR